MFRVHRIVAVFAAMVGGLLTVTVPVFARMGPSVLMIYGAPLRAPVVVRLDSVADLGTYVDFWGGRSERVVPAQFSERPYFNIAMFWGAALLDRNAQDLRPEHAHQQGRLYVATRDVGAAMVSTDYMRFDQPSTPGAEPAILARPVPTDVSAFKYGAWLSEGDLRLADTLGVPLRAK
jgi:hypothetical protein